MSRARVQISVDLEVLSPLHVGSGLDRTVEAVRGAEGANAAPRVAAIQRDAAGAPWLPGSTTKGLLRRIAGKDDDALLGSVERRGGLIAYGAALRNAGHAEHLPYADRTDHGAGTLGAGVFVAAGTRIERDTGVAAGSSLRHVEAVAPGSVFPLTFTIETRGENAEARCDEQMRALLQILSVLCGKAGWAIGAGQSDGDGRVRVREGTLEATKAVLGSDGKLQPQPLALPLPRVQEPQHAVERWSLLLECKGPFAVLDPSWAQQRQSGDNTPALSAQRSANNMPVLPGSSVMGALRARAAWIAACNALRAEKEPQRDDPTVTYKPLGRLDYTSVQRLFGMSGLRGLLEIEELTVLPGANPWQVFSVKLDRFSGGPISGGLFETAAFLGVKARLVLRLRDGLAGIPTADDKALAEELIKDICLNGLTLGHGGNKGFGWFIVKMETNRAD